MILPIVSLVQRAIYAALESDTDAALGLTLILLIISFALLLLFRHCLRSASEWAGSSDGCAGRRDGLPSASGTL